MGQDVQGILEYFKGSPATYSDYIVIGVLLLLIVLTAVLAMRELHLRKIAGNEEAFRKMKRPPRRVIKWREKKGIGVTTSRRQTPRLEKAFPVNVGTADGLDLFQAEIHDISAGGVRLQIFNPSRAIHIGDRLEVSASEPPLDIMGVATMEVMKVSPGEDEGKMVINGKWDEIDRLAGKALAREVRHQLNILAEEAWELEKAEREAEAERAAEAEREEESVDGEETPPLRPTTSPNRDTDAGPETGGNGSGSHQETKTDKMI